MQNIKDLEEKKLIIAYFVARIRNDRGVIDFYNNCNAWWKGDKCTTQFAGQIYNWHKDNYIETKTGRENSDIFKKQLLKYRKICDKNIRVYLDKSGLKENGYILRN